LTSNLSRKRRRFGTGKRVAKVAKNVMMSLAENKVRDRADPVAPGALSSYYHNTTYFHSLHNNSPTDPEHKHPTSLVQGDENYQRNGREVYSTGFRVRGVLDIPFDRRNTTVKIYQMEYNTNQGAWTDLFHSGVGTTGNKLLDRINTERFPGTKLLRTLRVKSRDLYVERGELTDGGSIATLKYDIWIPWKRKLSYKSAAGLGPTGGCKEIMGLAFVFYDAAETLETDAVCTRNEQSVSWYFKDP
jgi:hypothetical protein